MADANYQAALDEVWRKLRPHLELTDGFALIFLFASHPAPVDTLRKRLRDSLSVNTLPLRKFVLQGLEQVDDTLIGVLTSRPLDGRHPPLWLEMWRNAGNNEEEREAQRRAVRRVLYRLNERRIILERDVACPIVLVLPAELRIDIPGMVPDLWSVRSITADLPAPETVPRESTPREDYALPDLTASREPSAAEKEWQRLWDATENKQRLTPEAAFAAIDAALERLDYAAARQIADQVLPLLRPGEGAKQEPNRLRSYGIALNYSARVYKDLGRLKEARAAYAESLELSRRLRETLGDAPQTLRDLSIALDNIGGVDKDLGQQEEARAAYAESLELRRRLRETLGDVPQTLRDLSVSLDNIGGVDKELGRLEEARAVYVESLELFRRLRETLGDAPQTLRDLSVSLDNVGEVDKELGRLKEARAAYAESLELSRRLRETLGEMPQTLRDLSVSLYNIGGVDKELGRLE
ncbi:MAG: tetratricopeptide repeat protein, partial [Burkholderiaceae bacterium]|nr:tetratricopeptide repeat protein [Burkholderiaceae bacterium]